MGKIIAMKKYLVIVALLTLYLQSWTRADDISDFQIEGVGIGESLLDHLTLNKIKSEEEVGTKIGDYVMVYIYYDQNGSKLYDQVQVAYKLNDKKYIIHQVAGFLNFNNNISGCLNKKKEIEKELNEIFSNTKPISNNNFTHPYDKSGKTKAWNTNYTFDSGGVVTVGCMDWSKKFEKENKWVDSLDINITSAKYWSYLGTFYK